MEEVNELLILASGLIMDTTTCQSYESLEAAVADLQGRPCTIKHVSWWDAKQRNHWAGEPIEVKEIQRSSRGAPKPYKKRAG